MPPATVPDALLLLTSSCPNCPAVLDSLARLVKEGVLARLEIVNLQQRPEAAEEYGVRSVPWFRIGALRFQGVYPLGELRDWARSADTAEGLAAYLGETLGTGRLADATAAARRHPAIAEATARLLADEDTPMEVRIGLGAIYETLAGEDRPVEASDALREALAPLLHAGQARARNDACYLLGLAGGAAARPLLEQCLQDEDAEVRDTAREGLDLMDESDRS